MKVSRSSVCRVVEACLEVGARKAEIYLSPDLVVRATRRHKLNGSRCSQIHHEILLTIGKPNYAEREFIRDCKKAGEPFPVKKMQLKWFSEKKRK